MQSPEQQMNRELAVHQLASVDAELKGLPAERMVYAAANDFKASGSFKPAGKARVRSRPTT